VRNFLERFERLDSIELCLAIAIKNPQGNVPLLRPIRVLSLPLFKLPLEYPLIFSCGSGDFRHEGRTLTAF